MLITGASAACDAVAVPHPRTTVHEFPLIAVTCMVSKSTTVLNGGVGTTVVAWTEILSVLSAVAVLTFELKLP